MLAGARASDFPRRSDVSQTFGQSELSKSCHLPKLRLTGLVWGDLPAAIRRALRRDVLVHVEEIVGIVGSLDLN
jgi:hypothetical protein